MIDTSPVSGRLAQYTFGEQKHRLKDTLDELNRGSSGTKQKAAERSIAFRRFANVKCRY